MPILRSLAKTTVFILLIPIIVQATETDHFALSLQELTKVKVETAAKTPQLLADVAQTAYVIDAQKISEYGYRNIMEALASLPGFVLQNLDGLVIRGQVQTDEKFLLLVDGQAMTMRSDNYNILNSAAPVSMKDIEKIEVILYGLQH